jgi:hypothetical protein
VIDTVRAWAAEGGASLLHLPHLLHVPRPAPPAGLSQTMRHILFLACTTGRGGGERSHLTPRRATRLCWVGVQLHRLSSAALGLEPSFFRTAPETTPTSLLVVSHYPALEPDLGDSPAVWLSHDRLAGLTSWLAD